MEKIALVTGANSGIGEAVARDLLQRSWSVVGLARRPGVIEHAEYTHLSVDLADVVGLPARVEDAVGQIVADPSVSRLGLVNNAADPGLLGKVGTVDPGQMQRIFAVNVSAPVWLMGWILRRHTTGIPIRIVNVSSGVAVRPFPGMAPYGASKAALRMAGQVCAVELESLDNPEKRPDVSILSYGPGVVDTPMQTTVRTSSVELVPMLEEFVRFSEDGLLASAEEPAKDIADYLEGDGHAMFTEDNYAPISGTK